MVDAILLVLREVLEATLIITLLLAMSRKLLIALRWLVPALLLGLISSWLLAHYAYAISDALNATGQEWANVFLYLLVILAFIAITSVIAPLLFIVPKQTRYLALTDETVKPYRKLLMFCAIIAVGLSLAREVSEIWIYLNGFAQQPGLLRSAMVGGVIGLGVGASLGLIAYYFLVFISLRAFLNSLFAFLILLCGGLSMQIARQLLQIGLLDSAEPLWDSSDIVNEHSWLGELLYALIGYDSSPDAVQVVFYGLAIALPLLMLFWNWNLRSNKK